MIVRKAFKYRLDASPEQAARLRVLCGHARFVWNQALAEFQAFRACGEYVPLNAFRSLEAKLRKAQQALSRKVKIGTNWHKAKQRVQRLHTRIANLRRDYLHKLTTTICQNHAMIVVEDLQVSNMSASATGTVEKPGVNVKAKSGLNKSILDQGWYELRRQLEYKAVWSGGEVIPVPAHHTSQTCPECGHASAENRTTQAAFRCTRCHYENNADVVGALNILARGIAIRAKGGTSPGSPVV